MLVAAFVRPVTAVRLHRELDSRGRILMASSPLQLERLVRAEPIDALIVEPPLAHAAAPAVLGLIATYRSVPLVCVGSTELRTGHDLRAFWRVRPSFVLLEPDQDPAAVLGGIVAQAPSRRLVARVLRTLRRRLSLLPPTVGIAVEHLANCDDPPPTVATLSARTSRSRRSLERSLRSTGIRSARLLALLPRVVCAYCHLRDPAFTIRDVTRKVRASSPQVLLAQFRALTGLGSWSQLRDLPESQVVALAAAHLLCGARAPADGTCVHTTLREVTSVGPMAFAFPPDSGTFQLPPPERYR